MIVLYREHNDEIVLLREEDAQIPVINKPSFILQFYYLILRSY